MKSFVASTLALGAALVPVVSGHIAFWHPSMWGFNVTDQTFDYDNRPVVPLAQMPFSQWWFHNHLSYPPHKEDVFELPAGGTAHTELTCHKGATTWFASSEGPDIRDGDWPCPNSDSTEFHTKDETDVKGCALGIVYKNDVNDVKPEDFAIFSVNQTCVWNRFTDFQVPADMPACPEGGCICGWFWIHSVDSGSAQMFMNGFQCDVSGATASAPVSTPQLARRCGADPDNGKPDAAPSNCTVGAKQPLYWYQTEGNNMLEGQYEPPYYNDLYDFKDGAQNDIFDGSASSTQAKRVAADRHEQHQAHKRGLSRVMRDGML